MARISAIRDFWAGFWVKFCYFAHNVADLLRLQSTTRELSRLNDNLESVMLYFGIPRYTHAELTSPPASLTTVSHETEPDAAFREWLEEFHAARGRIVTAVRPEDIDFEDPA